MASMQAGPEVAARVGREHFAFTSIVGEGGFATVLLAMLLKTRGWYAVKEINKYALLEHKTGYDMILGELKALERIEHAFVANLHCAFNDKRSCYFVLELKTGGDLRHYLRSRVVFREIDVAFYVSCIASALNHIHSKGILHRDVKPENIVLDERGYPHLTDFGVAYVQENFEPGDVIACRLASGTRQYLAPEVFNHEHIHGVESDYWSLGAVAFELLYGGRPYSKHCPMEMIQFVENAVLMTRRIKKVFETQNQASTAEQQTIDKCGTVSFPDISPKLSVELVGGGIHEAKTLPSSPLPDARAGSADPPTDTAALIAETCCQLTTVDGTKSKPSLSPYRKTNSDENEGTRRDQADGAALQSNSPSRRTPRRRGYSAPDLIELLDEKVGYRDMLKETRVVPSEQRPSAPGVAVAAAVQSSKQRAATAEWGLGLVPTELVRAAETYGVVIHNYWTFDIEALPSHLQVPLPKHSSLFPEPVSGPFRDLLRGLLDPRPSHRLSDHSINDLRYHEALKACRIPDWEMLYQKRKYRPPFIPGRTYMENTFCSPEAYADYSQRLRDQKMGAERDRDSEKFITEEQEKLFKDFNYMVQPWARDLFPKVPARVKASEPVVVSVPTSVSSTSDTAPSRLIHLTRKSEPSILASMKELVPEKLQTSQSSKYLVGGDKEKQEEEGEEQVDGPPRNMQFLRARDSCDLIRKKRDQKRSDHLQKWAQAMGKEGLQLSIGSTLPEGQAARTPASGRDGKSGDDNPASAASGTSTDGSSDAKPKEPKEPRKTSVTRCSASALPPLTSDAPSDVAERHRKRSLLLGFLNT